MDNEEFSELEEIETSELPSVDPVKVLLNMKDETSKGVLLNCVTMFMSSNIPLMILNQNLNVVYISEPLRTMFGGMYKDLTLPFTTLFARAFTTELMKEFYEAIHNPDEKFSWKGTIQHKSNTMVGLYTKITAIPVLVKNNTPTGYLIIFEDITAEKKKTLKSIYKSILEASKLKDNETGVHNERVNHYAKCLALKLKETGKYPQIDPDFINDIGFLAGMHDVGKIGTPDEILKKKASLTEWEWSVMREHTINGAFILSNYPNEMAKEIALSHHEHWDGSGYPYHLEGLMIPLAARIVTVADVYDALRMKRNYKPGYSHEETCNIILSGRGTQFDPDIIDVFKDIMDDFDKIWNELKDKEQFGFIIP